VGEKWGTTSRGRGQAKLGISPIVSQTHSRNEQNCEACNKSRRCKHDEEKSKLGRDDVKQHEGLSGVH
jgi:hypothetical protein